MSQTIIVICLTVSVRRTHFSGWTAVPEMAKLLRMLIEEFSLVARNLNKKSVQCNQQNVTAIVISFNSIIKTENNSQYILWWGLCEIVCYSPFPLFKFHGFYLRKTTLADWNSMGRDIIQTSVRTFQTLGQAFQTLGRAFAFLLNPQKLGRVFQKLIWAFQRLGRMFWKKCSAESFDQ